MYSVRTAGLPLIYKYDPLQIKYDHKEYKNYKTIIIIDQQSWDDEHENIDENSHVINTTNTAYDIPPVRTYIAFYDMFKNYLTNEAYAKTTFMELIYEKSIYKNASINSMDEYPVIISNNCERLNALADNDIIFENPNSIKDLSFHYPNKYIPFWRNVEFVKMQIRQNAEDHVHIVSTNIIKIEVTNKYNKHVHVYAPNCNKFSYNDDSAYLHIEKLCDGCIFV